MRFSVLAIFFFLLFFASVIGYYIGIIQVNQKEIFQDWKNFIPLITSIIVAIIGIWRIVMEWFNEPSLKLDKISTDNGIYFIDVIKKRGKGKAEECEGWISLGKTDNTFPTIWGLNNKFKIDISEKIPLKLFQITDNSITFFSANVDGGYAPNQIPYNNVIDTKLTITVSSKNAKTPKPFKNKTIREIIQMVK
jgi:hypothetical protein